MNLEGTFKRPCWTNLPSQATPILQVLPMACRQKDDGLYEIFKTNILQGGPQQDCMDSLINNRSWKGQSVRGRVQSFEDFPNSSDTGCRPSQSWTLDDGFKKFKRYCWNNRQSFWPNDIVSSTRIYQRSGSHQWKTRINPLDLTLFLPSIGQPFEDSVPLVLCGEEPILRHDDACPGPRYA